MNENTYLIIILAIIIGEWLVSTVTDALNARHISLELPEEFKEYYDSARYTESQKYLRENTNFGIISDTFFTAVKVGLIVLGGFSYADIFARSFSYGPIPTGLVFGGTIFFVFSLLGIPFSAYKTFVIEEKYGFNRTSASTFVTDLFKSWFVAALIGGALFACVIWIFEMAGPGAWLLGWAAVSLFYLFLSFVAPVVIMPLFNKFVPVEDGELKSSLESYAREQNFKIKGLFKMDGSKRSTKSNAFFTGFGNYRRIVLFDTLIQKHTVDELVSVLAHEMGHYKKGHIIKSMLFTLANIGLMFFVLSFFVRSAGLAASFGLSESSVYAGIIFFGFLYSPISLVLSVISSIMSRRHEFEADKYAVTTYKKPEAMIKALKKLSVDNLSNLTPHPLKVFLEYSHPPVIERIKTIKALKAGDI